MASQAFNYGTLEKTGTYLDHKLINWNLTVTMSDGTKISNKFGEGYLLYDINKKVTDYGKGGTSGNVQVNSTGPNPIQIITRTPCFGTNCEN
ncbi:MAG TPA: hypothetical protein PKL06_01750 [Chitinophagales bacterium]|nr:hypothetical protein [Chitinophagales bacterium]